MKKVLAIFLIILGLLVFNITQAAAGCNIVYTGDLSGSVPTNETSRTPQAAQELSNSMGVCKCDNTTPSFISDNCYGYDIWIWRACASSEFVCIDGTWNIYCDYPEHVCTVNYWLCGSYEGTWDVICDGSTTTTSQPSTTTTTAPPTLINLSLFTATPKFSKVIIQWSTEAEIDNAGFNLYRAEAEAGKYIKINSSLIPAQGSATKGASYEFIDTNVQNRKTYYYKLEDIDMSGSSTMHGPVVATRGGFVGYLRKNK